MPILGSWTLQCCRGNQLTRLGTRISKVEEANPTESQIKLLEDKIDEKILEQHVQIWRDDFSSRLPDPEFMKAKLESC